MAAHRRSWILDLILHAITVPLDEDSFRMVEKAIEHRAGQSCVIVEELGPTLVRLIGGQDDGSALVAVTDHLEQQVGACLVDGQIPDLINDQN